MPILHGGSSKFRQGVLQLMIHSVDPLHSEIAQGQLSTSRPQSATKNGSTAQHHTHPPGATDCTLCAEDVNSEGMMNGTMAGTEDNNNPSQNEMEKSHPPPLHLVQVRRIIAQTDDVRC